MVAVVLTGVVRERSQLDHVGHVEDRALGVLVDGRVDGRLEVALEDDQVGLAELGGLA